MIHSHIPLKHFLKQIETYAQSRETRNRRPEWLTVLIENVAELFEPLSGVGRVGFDCQAGEDAWLVGLYLGRTEVVGGREDGRSKHANFEFDALKLLGEFTHVSEFSWCVVATPEAADAPKGHSVLRVRGSVGESPVALEVYSVPPEDVGPGMKELPSGEFEPY